MTITVTTTTATGPALVNTNTADNQFNPAVTLLTGGNYVVTWQSFNQEAFGAGYGLYAQIYTAAGAKVGSEFHVNTVNDFDQAHPSIAALTDGGFVVAYEDFSGIALQRFDGTGAKVGGEVTVPRNDPQGYQATPSVAGLAGGGYVVTYGTADNTAISSQLYDASGATVGALSHVNTTVANQQYTPVTAGLSGGNYVVAWVSNQYYGFTGQDILAQIYDNTGAKVGGEIVVNATTNSQQIAPAITALAGGGYLVTWQSNNTNGDYDIYFQRFNAAGVKVGVETLVNTTLAGAQTDPTVAATPDGGFFIAWDSQVSSNDKVLAQRFDANGVLVGGEIQLFSGSGTDQSTPAVVAPSNGLLASVWSVVGQGGAGRDVYQAITGQSSGVNVLTPGADVAVGDGADDVLTATSATLNSGDQLNGGGGFDTVQLAGGTSSFAGVTLTGFEAIRGGSGADRIIFSGAAPSGVAFDSGGGTDTLVLGGDTDLSGITFTGTWHVEGGGGSVDLKIGGGQVGLPIGGASDLTVDTTSFALTPLQRVQLLAQGADHVLEASGYEVSLAGGSILTSKTVTPANVPPQTPAVAALANGAYVVGWSTPQGIITQIFDAHGVASGPPTTVGPSIATQHTEIAALSGGGYVVTWDSVGQDGDAWGVVAQVYGANGAPVGTRVVVNTTTAGNQLNAHVAALTGGGFAIVWDGGSLQRFDAMGTKLGVETLVGGSPSSANDIIALADGGFLVSYLGGINGTMSFQRFDAAGVKVGAATALGTSYFNPAIAALPHGGFVLTWTNWAGSMFDPAHVLSQRFDINGVAQGAATAISSTLFHGPGQPEVIALADGGLVYSWVGDNGELWTKRYDASGGLVGTETRAATQTNTTIAGAALSDGGFVLSWLQGFAVTIQHSQGIDYHALSGVGASVAGTAADTLVDTSVTQFNVAGSLAGGSGDDTLELINSGVVDLTAPTAFSGFEHIAGASGGDTFLVSNARLAGVASVDGGGGANTLQLTAAGLLDLSGVSLQHFASVLGSTGDDTVVVSTALLAGVGTVDGGAGRDALSLAGSASGVSLTLNTGAITGFEDLIGSDFADHLTGDGGANSLLGGGGNDVLIGGAGDDTLDGGAGVDEANYALAGSGVTVNLGLAGAQATNGAGVDTLISIENLVGSNFADTLTGEGANNTLTGGVGDDVLDGAGGFDTVSYAGAASAVAIDLSLTTAQNTGGGGIDALHNFEAVVGSGFDDTFVIRDGATFTGGAGHDLYLTQGAVFSPASSHATLIINDFQTGASGDRVDFAAMLATTTWNGSADLFTAGYLQLVQTGADAVLRADADGGGDNISDLVVFKNTQASTFTSANFSGLSVAGAGGSVIGDPAEGTNTTASLAIGEFVNGAIDTPTDSDWYAVTLTAGQSYLFAENGAGGTALADPLLGLHAANGTILTFDDDGGADLNAALRFTPTVSGTYYIEASSAIGTGGYTLSATAVAAQDPLAAIDGGTTLPTSTVSIYFSNTGESFGGRTAEGSWTSFMVNQAMVAWASFAAVANVTFEQVQSAAAANVILVMGNLDDLGAGTIGLTQPMGGDRYAIIVDPSGPHFDTSTLSPGGVGYETLTHEMGHVLGLAHPHDDGFGSQVMEGVTGPFDSYGSAQLNQGVYTMMSYNDGWQTQVGDGPSTFATGYDLSPMALDIAVLQRKYGAPVSHAGADVYDIAIIEPLGFLSLWDTGGVDTIINSSSVNAVIDLRAATLLNSPGGGGYVSYNGALAIGGCTIANGVLIENAIGGAGNDILTGNISANTLNGGTGSDVLYGLDGADTLIGGGHSPGGADYLYGGAGNDTYCVNSDLAPVFDLVFEGALFAGSQAGVGDVDTIHSQGAFFWDYYSVGEVIDIDNAIAGGAYIVGGKDVLNKSINGSAGTDIISTYGHDSFIDAGAGTDAIGFSLYGLDESYRGHNTVAMKPGSGIDYVYDFRSGADHIDLSAFHFGITGDAVLAQAVNVDNAGTANDYCYFYLTSAGGVENYIVFMGLLSNQLHGSDFVM